MHDPWIPEKEKKTLPKTEERQHGKNQRNDGDCNSPHGWQTFEKTRFRSRRSRLVCEAPFKAHKPEPKKELRTHQPKETGKDKSSASMADLRRNTIWPPTVSSPNFQTNIQRLSSWYRVIYNRIYRIWFDYIFIYGRFQNMRVSNCYCLLTFMHKAGFDFVRWIRWSKTDVELAQTAASLFLSFILGALLTLFSGKEWCYV